MNGLYRFFITFNAIFLSVKHIHLASLLLRLGFGLSMMIGHGYGKFLKLISGEEIKFAEVLGLSPEVGLALAVFAEFFACFFIVIGYKTRLASIPIILTMAVAAFVIHGGDPWFGSGGSKEMAVLYLVGFIAVYMLDSGRYSLDHKLDNGI